MALQLRLIEKRFGLSPAGPAAVGPAAALRPTKADPLSSMTLHKEACVTIYKERQLG